MIKLYKTLLWVLAASACIVILSIRPQAAEYKLGPGDHYLADGSIASLNGRLIVDSDGKKISDTLRSDTAAGYTVIGNGSGSSEENVTSEIINGVSDRKISSEPVVVNTVQQDKGGLAEQQSEKSGSGSASDDGTVYSFDGRKYRKSALYGTRRLTGYAEEESGTAETFSGKTAAARHTVAAPSDIPLGSIIIVEGCDGPYASRYNGVYEVEDRGGAVLESEGFIDIFFDSSAEAEAVTAGGWNYAKIWIAEAVQ